MWTNAVSEQAFKRSPAAGDGSAVGFGSCSHGGSVPPGATGTAGDELLKVAMNDPNVQIIHVITQRPSPKIEAGVASGLVKMTIHMDYLDFSAVQDVHGEVDTVYWAIRLSARGLDEETYGRIHVDFPVRFISE